MGLKMLLMENIGPFEGEHEIPVPQIFLALIYGKKLNNAEKSNGVGKSHICKALEFAFFGQKRSSRKKDSTINDIVSIGKKKGAVTVHFDIDNVEYKIFRERNVKSNKTTLQLKYLDKHGTWKNYKQITTGRTMSATQAEIEHLIGMDRELYKNMTYFSQKDLEVFTTTKDTQRKEVVKSIIDLDYLDENEAIAKEKITALTKQIELLEMDINEISGQKEEIEQTKEQITILENLVSQKKQEIEDVEKILKELEKSEDIIRKYNALLEQKDEMEIDIRQIKVKYQNACENFKNTKTDIEQTIKFLQGQLANLPNLEQENNEIEKQLQKFKNIDNNLAKQEKKLSTWQTKKEDLNNILHQADLKFQQQKEIKNQELQKKIQDVETKKTEILKTYKEEELSISNTIQGNIDTVQQLKHTLEVANGQIQSSNQYLIQSIEDCKQNYLKIAGLSNQCPTCMSEIAEEKKQFLMNEEKNKGIKIKQQLEANIKTIEENITKISGQQTSINELLQQKVEQIESITIIYNNKQNDLIDQIAILRQENSLAIQTIEKLANDETQVTNQEIQQVNDSMGEITKQITEIKSEINLRNDLLKRQTEISTELAQKELYEEKIKSHQEQIEKSASDLSLFADACKDETVKKTAKLTKIEKEIQETELPPEDIINQIEHNKLIKTNFNNELVDLSKQLGSNEAVIKNYEEAVAESKEKIDEINSLKHKLSLWRMLAFTWGKNGLQSVIIENNLVEVEEVGRKYFNQFTDGEFDFTFTNKDDEGEIHPDLVRIIIKKYKSISAIPIQYKETQLSGGEELRLNLAIRLGLNSLDERSKSAKLGFLFFDEPTKEVDLHGQRQFKILLEKHLLPLYPKIFVISHDQRLQQMFQQSILVEYDGSKSTICL